MKKYLWMLLLTFAMVFMTVGIGQDVVYAADVEEDTEETTSEGWVTDSDGSMYYYVDGEAVTGMYTIEGSMYYFNADGTMYTGGWLTLDGVSYYFDSSTGRAVTGWRTIDGSKYFLTEPHA